MTLDTVSQTKKLEKAGFKVDADIRKRTDKKLILFYEGK